MRLLAILPTLILGGCCCCNVDWLIPDSVEDAAAEAIVREGLKVGTGVDVDIDEGRISVEGEDGRIVMGEGAANVDPRIPIAGHPRCKIAGGLSIEQNDEAALSFAQQDCDVPFDDLVSHYEKQLKTMSDDIKTTRMSQGQDGEAVVLVAEDGEPRFKKISVMLGKDEKGKTSAAVMVVVPE